MTTRQTQMSNTSRKSDVIDIEDMGYASNRSMRFEDDDSSAIRVRRNTAVSSSRINTDNPRPDASVRRPDLLMELEAIDKRMKDRVRPTIDMSRGMASVRIVPHNASRDSNNMSARSYRVEDYASKMPDKKRSVGERAYIIKLKFQKLNGLNPKIEVPDIQDPDALERMYMEALRAHHYSKTNSTWFIYLGVGYMFLQYLLNWFGLNLPDDFAAYQLKMISCYHDLLRQMGDPGGVSIGSSWPAWLKLLVIIVIQTAVFVIVYKMTKGNADAASSLQDVIASTGFMGGKRSDGDVAAEGAAVQAGGVMNMINGLLGGGGGNILSGVMNMFNRDTQGNDDEDVFEEPTEEDDAVSQSSRRSNIFD